MEAVLTGLLTKQTPERPAARSPALGWCCLGRRVDPRHPVVAGTAVFPIGSTSVGWGNDLPSSG